MKRKLNPQYIRAAFNPSSYNETDNTVEVVFATEAEVVRYGWDGKYVEILDLKPESVRLDRLNAGAPVLDNHSNYSVRDQIGVVQKAWIENKQGKAIIKLSDREDVRGIVEDVKSGILKNISVGYRVYELTESDKPKDEAPKYRATDWEPMELSLVCIPADHTAGVRSEETQSQYEVEIISNTRTMEPEVVTTAEPVVETRAAQPAATPAPVVTPATPDAEQVRSQAVTEERKRVADINLAVRAAGLDQAFADNMISNGTGIDQARAAIIQKLADNQQPTAVRGQSAVAGNDESVQFRSAVEEALLHRHNPSENKLESDKGKQLRHATLLDLATLSLQMRGESVSLGSISRDELVERAMSTSDFPLMLGNTVSRSLRAAYQNATPAWKEIARKQNATDFKAIASIGIGGDFKLKKIKEGGEYEHAVMAETGDNFKLDTYGRKISITRQAIINDDLDGFMRYTELFGNGAAQLEADIVYGLLTANSGAGRKLADGKNLFHVDHKNLAASGATLSVATLTAARLALRRQTGLSGEKIIIRPKYLVVPPELETIAYQLVYGVTNPTDPAQVNPFKGAFEVIVEPFLDNATAWYVVADPATIPVIQYAFLNGNEGLYTEQKLNFETDNLDIKVRTDFAATIEEFRGIYRNPGA